MKRLVLILFFILISLQIFAGGTKEAPVKETVPLDISVAALKGPTGISMLGLIDKNPSLGEGINVNYEIVNSPDLMVSRVLSGEIDIASFPANLAAKIYNRGAPYVLGGITGYAAFSVLTLREDTASFKDLRGKTLYNVGKGANTEILVNHLLLANGIDPEKDITLDYRYSHLEIAPLLISGKIDLALLPEPFASMVRMRNSSVRVAADIQKEWKKIHGEASAVPVSVVIIKRAILETHPEAAAAFFREYAEAVKWINANPSEGGALAEKYMELPAAVTSAAIGNLNLVFIPAADGREEMEAYLTVLMAVDADSVGGKLPDEAFYSSK